MELQSVEKLNPPLPGLLKGVLVSQGAEARIFATTFLGKPSIIKERFSKHYRHPILDSKLTSKRLHGEARSLFKARKLGVLTPVLYAVDTDAHCIVLEQIFALSVKDLFLQLSPTEKSSKDEIRIVAHMIGRAIAKLHDGGLIHGDLTTSNMLLRTKETEKTSIQNQDQNQNQNQNQNQTVSASVSAVDSSREISMTASSKHDGDKDDDVCDKELVMIDFGLAFNSTLPEDKAVDLYVLERALLSLHSTHSDIMDNVLSSYSKASRYWSSTLNKLAIVRMRGRKRVMLG